VHQVGQLPRNRCNVNILYLSH